MTLLVHERAPSAYVLDTLPELAAQAAHDLNNHLATILGKSELALMLGDPGRFRPALSDILNAGQPARTVVADVQRVLGWVRGAAEPVCVAEVLGIVARLVGRRCERAGVELACRPNDGVTQSDDPAAHALLIWGLLRQALETPPAGDALWSIESRLLPGGLSLSLTTPGYDWGGEASAEFARASAGAEELGGRIEVQGERVELVLPRDA